MCYLRIKIEYCCGWEGMKREFCFNNKVHGKTIIKCPEIRQLDYTKNCPTYGDDVQSKDTRYLWVNNARDIQDWEAEKTRRKEIIKNKAAASTPELDGHEVSAFATDTDDDEFNEHIRNTEKAIEQMNSKHSNPKLRRRSPAGVLIVEGDEGDNDGEEDEPFTAAGNLEERTDKGYNLLTQKLRSRFRCKRCKEELKSESKI